MKQFENGVKWFVKGKACIDIFFPEGEIRCQYCPFCRAENDLKRFWCRLTNAMIYNPFTPELPEICPIEFTGEVIGKKEE